jgi:hypothetical protein
MKKMTFNYRMSGCERYISLQFRGGTMNLDSAVQMPQMC